MSGDGGGRDTLRVHATAGRGILSSRLHGEWAAGHHPCASRPDKGPPRTRSRRASLVFACEDILADITSKNASFRSTARSDSLMVSVEPIYKASAQRPPKQGWSGKRWERVPFSRLRCKKHTRCILALRFGLALRMHGDKAPQPPPPPPPTHPLSLPRQAHVRSWRGRGTPWHHPHPSSPGQRPSLHMIHAHSQCLVHRSRTSVGTGSGRALKDKMRTPKHSTAGTAATHRHQNHHSCRNPPPCPPPAIKQLMRKDAGATNNGEVLQVVVKHGGHLV